MSVAAFFEKFTGLQQKRAQEKVASYLDLVARIATGKAPEPAEVEPLLAGASKSVDDLKHDVEVYGRRAELKALVAAVPGLEAERRKIDQQIAAADRALEAAEKQHKETTNPLHAAWHRIKHALSEASDAKRELYHTCPDQGLRRELDELNVEAERLHEALGEAQDKAKFMEDKAEAERIWAEKEISPVFHKQFANMAAQCQREAEGVRALVTKLARASEDIHKRREQLEQRIRAGTLCSSMMT